MRPPSIVDLGSRVSCTLPHTMPHGNGKNWMNDRACIEFVELQATLCVPSPCPESPKKFSRFDKKLALLS